MGDNKNKTLPGGVTQAQIDDWKVKHGKVFKLKVASLENKETVLTGYARKPTKSELAAAMPFINSDPVKAGDILRNACYLAGDPELSAKDEYIMAVNIQVGDLFRIPMVEVEEL